MRSLLLAGLCAVTTLVVTAPADARWSAGGTGSGPATTATMPAGNQPGATVAGQSVTISWSQSSFQSSPLGGYAGGGYSLTRYRQSTSTATTPNAACSTVVSGGAATLQCVEAGVGFGHWQYTVTPVLNSFTGAPSARSAAIDVVPATPDLTAATAQNPATGQATGAIALTWATVSGATGYNVYRRAAAGAYDFAAPLNGATPVAATTYSDTGPAAGTTYDYVVRAVGGSPAVESASSNERAATPITRPSPPTGLTAVPAVGATMTLAWSSVAGAVGYNVYRRTTVGTYDYAAPLNGGTPVSATTFTDATAVNGTAYRYTVRTVVTGTGGAQVESDDSAESAAATADGTAPGVPTAAAVTGGGPVIGGTTCGVAAGTRFVNLAGRAAVTVTATIPAPEAGESVVFAAGSVTSTVSAGGTSVGATLNLTPLADGAVTLTARTRDAAGNLSATVSPTNAVVKDTVAPTFAAPTYVDHALAADALTGTSECGATITAVKTAGAPAGPFSTTIASGTAYTLLVSQSNVLNPNAYSVTSADIAGNVSTARSVTDTTLL